jgi:hypothetical protein
VTGDGHVSVAPASTRIRAATDAASATVAALLHAEFAPVVSEQAFRRLAEYAWLSSPPDRGILIESDAEVAGYLGTLYSDRVTQSGEAYRVCSLSSWYVRAAHRSLGLAQLLRVTRQPAVTVMCLSPNLNASPIYEKCGFVQYSTGFQLYPPTLRALGGAKRGSRPRLLSSPADLHSVQTSEERRFASDHAGYGCRQYAVADALGVTCLTTMRRVRAGRIRVPLTEVIYSGSQGALLRNFAWVVRALCLAERSVGIAFDEPVLGAEAPKGARFRPRIRYGKGPHVSQAARDSLYSEMIMLA